MLDTNKIWKNYDPKTYRQNSRCLSVNTILAGKYLVGPVLGQGGFGITYQGYDLNMETLVAIKEYFPVELVSRDTTTIHGDRVLSLGGEKSVTYRQGLEKYVAEAQNVSQFSEVEGVVSVKDFFYENETAYLVMEYLEGQSLKEYLKERGGRLSEEETLRLMKPVLEALKTVHDAGIVHRDISPDNIMLTNEVNESAGRDIPLPVNQDVSVKLIDFGAARMTAKNDQKSLTIILKHGYAPEEQYRTRGEQGPWTDVYAICATMYRMLTGETPVPAMDRLFIDDLKTFEQLGVKVSRQTEDAIMKGLAVKKENRIQTMDVLCRALYEKKPVPKKRFPVLIAGLIAGAAAAVFFAAVAVQSDVQPSETQAVSAEESAVIPTEENVVITGSNATEASKTVELDDKEQPLGPQVVRPRAETMLACGFRHLLSLREDGKVYAAGDNNAGQCDVTEWTNIAAVYANSTLSAGLRADGTVAIAGMESLSEGTSSWTGITQLAVGYSHILGLTEDGRVISAGTNKNGCCETGDWEDITAVYADDGISVGIKKDGTLEIAGSIDNQEDLIEQMLRWTGIRQVVFRHQAELTCYGLHEDGTVSCAGQLEDDTAELKGWSEITWLLTGDGFVAGLSKDGTVKFLSRAYDYAGRGEELAEWGNLIAMASTQYDIAALLEDGTILVTKPVQTGNSTLDQIQERTDILQADWTQEGLAALTKEGEVIGAAYGTYYGQEDIFDLSGIEKMTSYNAGIIGITGDGRITLNESNMVVVPEGMTSQEAFAQKKQTPRLWEDWENVKAVSGSSRHMAALLEDGTVRAAGYPAYQDNTDYQTGRTKDGACATQDWRDIRQVAALNGITVGLRSDGTLATAGNVGEDLKTRLENWEKYRNLTGIYSDCKGIRLVAIDENQKAVNLLVAESTGQGNTAGWEDLVQMAVSERHTVGLRKDGTVVAVGSNFCGQCEVEDWTNAVYVSAGPTSTAAVTADGRILIAGTLPNDVYVAEQWPAVSLNHMSLSSR